MARRSAFAVIAVVVLSAVSGCGQSGNQGSAPPSIGAASPATKMPPLEKCVDPSDHATQVAFPSADGETVYGASFGNGTVGVVLAHQYMGDLCDWVSEARRLRDQGRRVLVFDFGRDLVKDVVGAAAEVRREGSTKVVLVGASMGGTAALVAATTIAPAPHAVASLPGPAIYRSWSAIDASKQLTMPVLFMDALNSRDYPEDAKAMYAACPSASKQLVLLPGTDHGAALLTNSVADQARTVLEKFISDSVGT